MNLKRPLAVGAVVAGLTAAGAAFAAAPQNPGFETGSAGESPPTDWSQVTGSFTGTVEADDVCFGDGSNANQLPTEGELDAVLTLSPGQSISSYGTGDGPGMKSSTFAAAKKAKLSFDWQAVTFATDNWDTAIARAWLYKDDDTLVHEFTPIQADFSDGSTVTTGWQTEEYTFADTGNYYLLYRVDSYDSTGGNLIGGKVCVDNIQSNARPKCKRAKATIDTLWPPNHKLVTVGIEGVTDPDGDDVTIKILGVKQDEPTDASGDGTTCPDAVISEDGSAVQLRAERDGPNLEGGGGPGDGRVYRVHFRADDGYGGYCTGSVKVGVPHDKSSWPVNSGTTFNSEYCH